MSRWPVRSLSEVVELQRGHDLPADERRTGDVPIIGSFGITGYHDVARYAGPGVAIGRSGASIGKATYVASDYWPLNTCLFVKDFKGNDPRWVYWLLDQIEFEAFNSGSAQPSLNRNFLKTIPIPTPSLPEQQAIAEVLGALDDKIAANTSLARTVYEFLTAVYEEAASHAEDTTRLSDLVSTQYGVTTSATPSSNELGLLRVTDINKQPWIEWPRVPGCEIGAAERAKYLVAPGDILVARMADPGKVAWIAPGDPPAVFASYLVRLQAVDRLLAPYLFLFLRSAEYRRYADSAMQGSVQKNMNARVIVDTSVRLPARDVLEAFALQFEQLWSTLSSALHENQTLAVTRDSLLPQLMSGKLRVRDIELPV